MRPADVQTEKENKLFVGMLPKTVDEPFLEEMFSKYGKIKEIHVMRTTEVRGSGKTDTELKGGLVGIRGSEKLKSRRIFRPFPSFFLFLFHIRGRIKAALL